MGIVGSEGKRNTADEVRHCASREAMGRYALHPLAYGFRRYPLTGGLVSDVGARLLFVLRGYFIASPVSYPIRLTSRAFIRQILRNLNHQPLGCQPL